MPRMRVFPPFFPPVSSGGVTTGAANKVATAALAHDLLLLTTSVYECIRFIPPLNVTKEEVDIGLERVEAALDAAFC